VGMILEGNFFSIPHEMVDSGLLSSMSGSQAKLYMVLLKLANRFGGPAFFHSDKELLNLTGIKDNKTLTKAKKVLKRMRLIDYKKYPGKRTDYRIVGAGITAVDVTEPESIVTDMSEPQSIEEEDIVNGFDDGLDMVDAMI